MKLEKKCEWTYDDYCDHWDTGCLRAFVFVDGGVKENEMNFCPFCGKKIDIQIRSDDKE
jgi:rRNA maturation endonuclease Nob1